VVSTWGLANLEISVPIGPFPVDGAEETFVNGRIDAVVGDVAANVGRALGRLGVAVHAHLVVGTDGLGAQVRSQLDGWEGVEATVIPTRDCPRTVVLYADDGQRHILMDPRAAASTDFPADTLARIDRSPGSRRTARHPACHRRALRHPHRRHGSGVGRRGHDHRCRGVGDHHPRLLHPARALDARGR
jgi:sugar/nucleoside kinase (ribokinase family)